MGGVNQSGGGGGWIPARLLPRAVQDESVGGRREDGLVVVARWPSVPSLLTLLADPRPGRPPPPPPPHLLRSSPPTQRSLQANHRLRGQKYS